MYDYGVYLRLRYMTLATDGRGSSTRSPSVFHEFRRTRASTSRFHTCIPIAWATRAARAARGAAAAEVVKLDMDQINEATLDGGDRRRQVSPSPTGSPPSGCFQPIVVRQNRGGQYDVLAATPS
jgi:hypothetical protein